MRQFIFIFHDYIFHTVSVVTVIFLFLGPLTKAILLLIIAANLPGETGASPWNRRAEPGSEREKELLEKTCQVRGIICSVPAALACF